MLAASGFEDADTSVVAAVPVYGRYDMVSTEGVGRGPFVKVLLRWLVMKKDWRTHPEIYRDAHLGAFYQGHGQPEKAEPVLQRAQAIQERGSGMDHPTTSSK